MRCIDFRFSAALRSVAAVANNTGFYVGGPDAGIYMNGNISSPMAWSRVLTSDERDALWNGGAGNFYPFTGA